MQKVVGSIPYYLPKVVNELSVINKTAIGHSAITAVRLLSSTLIFRLVLDLFDLKMK